MKKLLLFLAFIAIATFAHAEIDLGPVECEGSGNDRVCTQTVTCDIAPCEVIRSDQATNNAICTPVDEDGFEVTMVAEVDGEDPSCTWTVSEQEQPGDGIVVVIDSSVGLPVETESFSVE